MSDEDNQGLARREFLKRAAALTGAVGVGAGGASGAADLDAASTKCMAPDAGASKAGLGAGEANPAATPVAASSAAAPFIGYVYFSPDEAAFAEALVNILCPADQYTPNGVDCGLATFMDRQLAGAFGQGKGRYMHGPWRAAPPEMGPQSPLTPAQLFSAGVRAMNAIGVQRHGVAFDQLPAAQADALLHEAGSGKLDAPVSLQEWFNGVIYPLFVQGCFADPVYGGNHDKVFWKMLGYPGLPATHAQDIIRYRGKPFPGAATPKSMLDFS